MSFLNPLGSTIEGGSAARVMPLLCFIAQRRVADADTDNAHILRHLFRPKCNTRWTLLCHFPHLLDLQSTSTPYRNHALCRVFRPASHCQPHCVGVAELTSCVLIATDLSVKFVRTRPVSVTSRQASFPGANGGIDVHL